MKVKALSRSKNTTVTRANKGDVHVQHRNLNPTYHPHRRAREYTRAVQAAKLDRMFAKPFLGSLGEGHRDAVTCTATSRTSLLPLVSGGADGQVLVWDVPTRQRVREIRVAHAGAVTGVCVVRNQSCALSGGVDGKVRLWELMRRRRGGGGGADDDGGEDDDQQPLSSWTSPHGPIKSIDYHWTQNDIFCTASDGSVDLWSLERSEPVQSYLPGAVGWGDDTVHVVRCHPSEPHLLANASLDRGVALLDTRAGVALRKTVLAMRANALAWNPVEPLNLVVANEDGNCYTFDTRRLHEPTNVHRGHVSAVLDVAFSPTGQEFATASYDKTVRIYPRAAPVARDVYHLKRMQRVFTVRYTPDAQYLVSGSDDGNLRLWKALASQRLCHRLSTREEQALDYRRSLVEKYKEMPEIRKIVRSRNSKIPTFVRKQAQIQHLQREAKERKLQNRIKNSKPGSIQAVPPRKKTVVKEVK